MKKMFKNKLIPMAIALVLCLSASIGFSLAYFSDYEEAAGGATLHLGGRTELDEGTKSDAKHITVKNTGETNMIVRVAIYGEDQMDVTLGDDWSKSGADGFYYYKEILKPEGSTSEITATVKQTDQPYDYEVTVVHEGSQAIYDGDVLVAPNGWDPDEVSKIGPKKEGVN